jgi:hypothetical protein
MNVNLRPMNLGEILDRTFQIYRAKFLVFVGIAAIPALVMMALNFILFVFDRFGPQTTLSASFKDTFFQLASWLPREWPYSFCYCLIWPAFVYVASRIFLDEKPTFTSAYYWCAARWKSCLVLSSVLWVVWHLVPNVLNRLAFVGGLEFLSGRYGIFGNFPIQSFLDLARWILNYMLIVMLAFSVPAWSLEGMEVRPALRRGWTFAKQSWMRVLFAWILANVLEWILFAALNVVSLIVLRLISSNSFGDMYFRVHFALIMPEIRAISIFITPLLPIALTLFYYDQRIRKEGYDIERMMEEAGLTAPVTTPTETKVVQA